MQRRSDTRARGPVIPPVVHHDLLTVLLMNYESGARRRVSKVLVGKRRLSSEMCRALYKGLRILLESLVAHSAEDEPPEDIQWDRFPV